MKTSGSATVHFVAVEATRADTPYAETAFNASRDLLERIELWAEEDREEDTSVMIETAIAGADRYLFSPGDYADTITDYADAHAVDTIVLDPEYDPGVTAPMLRPLQGELSRSNRTVEVAAVERAARRTVLTRAGNLRKYVAVFAASVLFYLSLGQFTTFDLVTGAATAAFTSLLLAPIAFGTDPKLRRVLAQLARFSLYGPYLLWQIAKANVHIARVVLHPSLPIQPRMIRFRPWIWGDVPVTTLANSITLTPGTLTVDVEERAFAIHTLTEPARADLLGGGLERAVSFVFFGRVAAQIPSPRERDAITEHTETGGEPDSDAVETAVSTDAEASGDTGTDASGDTTSRDGQTPSPDSDAPDETTPREDPDE